MIKKLMRFTFGYLMSPSSAALLGFTDATNEGKMHALRGLRQTHPFVYDEIAATLQPSDILVTVMKGCIMESVPAGHVVQEISQEALASAE